MMYKTYVILMKFGSKCQTTWDSVVGNKKTPPRISRLPPILSKFLGYRSSSGVQPVIPNAPEWARLLQVLVVTYAALCVQSLINKYGYPFRKWDTPSLVPSFGASAILCFNAAGSPLAQPRNMFFGTLISAFVGIVLQKFWLERESNEQYLWLGAPLACSISSVVMTLSKCIHPPAGAAAMIPLLQPDVRQLGWKYLLVELVGCTVFLAFACLFDNICAQYPTHWWSPHLAPSLPKKIEITAASFHTSVDVDDRFMDLVSELQGYLDNRPQGATRVN